MKQTTLLLVLLLVCPCAFAQPANDDCAAAISITTGITMTSTSGAGTDGPPSCPTNQDIWYSFAAPLTGTLEVGLCGSIYDTYLSVYPDTGVCPPAAGSELACNDDSCGLQSFVTVPVVMGDMYLIRVGGFTGSSGTGQLSVSYEVLPVTGLMCTANGSTVDLNWTNGTTYDEVRVYVDGVLDATLGGGQTTYTTGALLDGTHTICVEGFQAAAGPAAQACCSLFLGQLTDLILDLEGAGATDSTGALVISLQSLGLNPAVETTVPITAVPFLAQAERIWVMTGTFPDDYRISAAEGDALAAVAAQGTGIYFEGGDHWGFQHAFSGLDARDGVESDIGANISDGDDSFTSMDGQDASAVGIDLSGFAGVVYSQDQGGNDYTDRLEVTGTTAGATPDADILAAAATWRDASSASGYITGVAAIHNDGGVMISSSWEFGGFGGNQENLASSYLSLFGSVVGTQFVRGECNNDGSVNLPDAVFLLTYLFPPSGTPAPLDCIDACDTNDDGSLNLVDAVAILNALFGQPIIPLPGPATCGTDPTANDALDCQVFGACP